MSLFISGLALGKNLLESGKIGALVGSAISATVGFGLLWWSSRKEKNLQAENDTQGRNL